jgi:hypothetical protein
VSTSARQINALTATVDGQVWFVEDQKEIFAIDLDGTVNRIERPPERIRRHVDGLAIDPRFSETRYVYVQEIERLRDGSRELTISRYREVTRALRERTVIVSGVRLPATGNAPFTVDGDGRVFVAVPGGRGATAYAGEVLTFQSDGSLAQTRSVFALSSRGLSSPSGLVWDAARSELWLSGANSAGASMIARIGFGSQSGVNAADSPRDLILAAPGGRMVQIDRHTARAEPVSIGGGQKITAVAGSGHDVVFAATYSSANGSRIVAIPLAH